MKIDVIIIIIDYCYQCIHAIKFVSSGMKSCKVNFFKNGVKQGCIISPNQFVCILVYYYVNCKRTGIWCRIGNLLTGVIAYAYDITLLARTVAYTYRAMRYMLKLYDDYANSCSIMFNATTSKCVVVNQPRMCAWTELMRINLKCKMIDHSWITLSIVSVTTMPQLLMGVIAWLHR